MNFSKLQLECLAAEDEVTQNAGSNADSSYAAVNLLISVVSLKAYSHGRVEIMVYVVFSAFAPYLLWKSHKTQREDMRNLPGEQ